MKILFIYTNIGTYNPPHFQPGIGALSAFVKAAGHSTGLLAIDQPISEQEFLYEVKRQAPEIIGFHANSQQWSVVRELARWCKAAFPDLAIVIGGTHATTMPEDVLAGSAADFVVVGEGEHALGELLDALALGRDPSAIANLGFRHDQQTTVNPVRPLIGDLDTLPFTDHALFDFQYLLDANLGEAPYMAGRGCPFTCAYCCNNFLQRIYAGQGRYVRFHSPARIIAELGQMKRDYRFSTIYFQDDTFTLDKRWLGEFVELYSEKIKVPYRVQARVDIFDEEMVEMLAASGCHYINFGIEAGDERVRRTVLKRNISDEQIKEAFELARAHGLKVWSYNIIGSPGEGEQEIRRTIEINRQLEPDHVQVSIFNPYPGTELYDRCLKECTIDRNIAEDGLPLSFFVELPAIDRGDLSDQRLRELYDEFVQLGLMMSARRSARGYFDFLDHFEAAGIESTADDHVNLQEHTVAGDQRLCLFAHPPARVSFQAQILPTSRLVFAIALNPEVWDRDIDGVRFSILIDGEVAFDQEIDPSREPGHRNWLEFLIEFAEVDPDHGDSTITFITEAVGRTDFSWALWSRPHLALAQGGES